MYQTPIEGIRNVLKEYWNIYTNESNKDITWFHKLAALKLAKECNEDEELRLRLRLRQDQEDIEKWHSDYIELMEYIKNVNYISYCACAEANRVF